MKFRTVQSVNKAMQLCALNVMMGLSYSTKNALNVQWIIVPAVSLTNLINVNNVFRDTLK